MYCKTTYCIVLFVELSNKVKNIQLLKVSEYKEFIPSIVEHFRFRTKLFQAGQISSHISEWTTLTSDREILETVSGRCVKFSLTPVQVFPPLQPNWSKTEGDFTDNEILMMLHKGVIKHSVHVEEGEYISSIFLRPKDGS